MMIDILLEFCKYARLVYSDSFEYTWTFAIVNIGQTMRKCFSSISHCTLFTISHSPEWVIDEKMSVKMHMNKTLRRFLIKWTECEETREKRNIHFTHEERMYDQDMLRY